jgi:hypothetical protein
VNPVSFANTVIMPVLQQIDLFSPAAQQLLLGTALQESGLAARRQLGGGPALGLYQMEPATANDIWTNFLNYRPQLAKAVGALLSSPTADRVQDLENNDRYATAMARVKYARAPEPLPPYNDLKAMARYWWQYYNTPRGAGSPAEFVANWNKATRVAAPTR